MIQDSVKVSMATEWDIIEYEANVKEFMNEIVYFF